MNTLIIFTTIIISVFGIIFCFLPLLPGPIISWLSFMILKYFKIVEFSLTFLIITFLLSLFISFIDNLLPSYIVKKYGGTNKGIKGAFVGSIVGFIFLGFVGMMLGTFVGTIVGELQSKSDFKKVIKSSINSLIGFFSGTFVKITISLIYLIIIINEVI